MAQADAAQSALPGSLESDDLRDPVQALAFFYRAFNDGDIEKMDRVWDHSPEAVVISPVVGITRGWPAIRAAYEHGFKSPSTLRTAFYDFTIQRFTDIFVAIGRERAQSVSSTGTSNLAAQATNIFRKSGDGTWKLLHHHVSLAGPPA